MADPVHQIPQRAPEQAEAGTQISGARVSDDSCAGHRRTNLPRHLHQRPKRPRLDTHRPSSTLTQYATSGHLPSAPLACRSGTRSDRLGRPCAHTRSVGKNESATVGAADDRSPQGSSPTARRALSLRANWKRRHRRRTSGGVVHGCHSERQWGWSCRRSLSPAARRSGKPRGPAIRGTRTCISRTDRPGPSPRGSNDTCSRRRPARRSFWAGGLPRRLRRCADPPAGRAPARR